MNFTNNPYEKMMKQKPRPLAPSIPKAPGVPGAPTGGGSAVCPATGSF